MAEVVITFRSTIFNGNLTGTGDIYMMTDIPEGLSSPNIRESEQVKQGVHGIIDQVSYYGKRVLTFTGKIISDTEAGRLLMQRNLEQIFALDSVQDSLDSGYYDLTILDESSGTRIISVKVTSGIEFSKDSGESAQRDFIVSLKAKDPWYLGATLYSNSLVEALTSTTFKLPTKLPTKIIPLTKFTEVLTNNGNFAAPPIITLTGQSTNPRIINQTTGREMKINTTLSTGQTIIIDVGLGTIEKDSVDISSSLDDTSRFLYLDPGANTIEIRDDSPVAPDLDVNFQWKDTYI